MTREEEIVDLSLSPADEALREEARTWLTEHVPSETRPPDGRAMREFDLAWQREQYDGGWAGISWPPEHGGRGLTPTGQMLWFEQYAAVGAPPAGVCFVGNSHGGPTIMARGSASQQQRFLPEILAGEVVWCQGFSEPDAGSDLAGIRTRAEIDGDSLVVTGQKIWTSYADLADRQELLVRTSDGRHDGLTWIVCDMDLAGIDVRAIRTMEGYHDLCEVFYDEVAIPAANIVGEIDAGWSVAMSTLGLERGTAFMADQVEMARFVSELAEIAGDRVGRRPSGVDSGVDSGAHGVVDDDEIRRTIATLAAEVAAMRALTYAGISRAEQDGNPGPQGSITRLYLALLRQRLFRVASDLLGHEGLVLGGDDPSWGRRWLRSFASTIGSGTSDIQREIIATRVLGLPRTA